MNRTVELNYTVFRAGVMKPQGIYELTVDLVIQKQVVLNLLDSDCPV